MTIKDGFTLRGTLATLAPSIPAKRLAANAKSNCKATWQANCSKILLVLKKITLSNDAG